MTLVQLHETWIESDVIVVTTFRYASMVHHADEFFLVSVFWLYGILRVIQVQHCLRFIIDPKHYQL